MNCVLPGVLLAEFPAPHAFDDRLFKQADEPAHRLARCRSKLRISVIAFDGQVDDRATAFESWALGRISKYPDQCAQLLLGGFLFGQCREKPVAHARKRMIEGFEGKRLPALEMVVDTSLLQAGDLHDFGHRSAKVTLAVKQSSRLGDDSLPCRFAFSFHHPGSMRPIGLFCNGPLASHHFEPLTC